MPQELTELQNEATARGCGCSGVASWQACGWWRFIQSLPPTDPVRMRDEAGDPLQNWEDPRWTGEGCRCHCHDNEDTADFHGSEAECLRVALENPRYR